MKSGCAEHPKTKELQRLMQAPLYRVIGVLESLWYMTTHYADDGHIMRLGAGKIESWMGWDGAPGELIKWLEWTGFIDDDGYVHDWLEHCPKYISDRLRKRVARTGDVRKRRILSASVASCPQVSLPTESVPSPSPTQPNPTDTESEPEAGSVPQAADAVARASGTGTDSVFEVGSGGSGSEGGGRYAMANAAWQKAKTAIKEHRDAEAIEDFAHAVVMVLKPDSASESDYADARAFGRSLCCGDGARALVARMFDAFNDAKATVEQSGGWGLWRNHMTERFGKWSSRKSKVQG